MSGRRQGWRNLWQSAVLILGMMAVAGLSAFIVFGAAGLLWAALGFAIASVLMPSLPPETTLSMYRARPIPARDFPAGHRLIEALAERANLPAVPTLYHVPSPMLNAFTLGSPRKAAIAVTDGMLRRLTYDEFAGVMAHEIAHIAHKDLWIMSLADALSRMTSVLASLAVFIVFLGLPMVMLGLAPASWAFAFLLLFAPAAMTLLQLGLSRAREYDADLKAAELTGNPRALASALSKVEKLQGGMWERLLMPGRRVPEPSLLRTHPPTQERVRRLLALGPPEASQTTPFGLEADPMAPPPTPGLRIVRLAPRWHWTGLWY